MTEEEQDEPIKTVINYMIGKCKARIDRAIADGTWEAGANTILQILCDECQCIHEVKNEDADQEAKDRELPWRE